MNWTIDHIEKLKAKGKIKDFIDLKPKVPGVKVRSKDKISIEKKYIESYLKSECEAIGHELSIELKFSENRKFRFDWAIPELMIAIEYEGIYSKKSRHTTQSGYTKDTEKYNLAASLGWKVYRYTAKTYKNITNDLKLNTIKK